MLKFLSLRQDMGVSQMQRLAQAAVRDREAMLACCIRAWNKLVQELPSLAQGRGLAALANLGTSASTNQERDFHIRLKSPVVPILRFVWPVRFLATTALSFSGFAPGTVLGQHPAVL